jgi:hypothetical protein
MEVVQSFETSKGRVAIVLDQEPLNPREDHCLGTIYHWHSRYDLGERILPYNPDEVRERRAEITARMAQIDEDLESLRKLKDEPDYPDSDEDSDLMLERDRLEHELDELAGGPFDPEKDVYLPVYMYDHSGITINTTGFSCPWDSGQVGWIVATKATVLKEFGVSSITPEVRVNVEGVLRTEIAVFDRYLRGEVYGYILYAPAAPPCSECGRAYEEVSEDSCWGFYDELDDRFYTYILEEQCGVPEDEVRRLLGKEKR